VLLPDDPSARQKRPISRERAIDAIHRRSANASAMVSERRAFSLLRGCDLPPPRVVMLFRIAKGCCWTLRHARYLAIRFAGSPRTGCRLATRLAVPSRYRRAIYRLSLAPRLPMRLTACSSRSLVRSRGTASPRRRCNGDRGENSKLNPAEARPGPGRSLPAENDTSPSERLLPFSRDRSGNRVIDLSRSSVPVRR